MSIDSIVNISFDAVYIIIMLLILICLAAGEDRDTKLSKVFLIMCLLMLAFDVFDMIGWIFDGSTALFAKQVSHIFTFLMYLVVYPLSASFDYYIFTYISTKAYFNKKITYAVMTSWVIAFCIMMFLMLNQSIFYINENNEYVRANLFMAVYIWPYVTVFIDLAVLIKYRKVLGLNDTMAFSIYLVSDVIALALRQMDIGVNIIFESMTQTIVIAVIYFRVQLEQARRLKQTQLELQDAQISVMLSQIQPHFMYDTLDTIKNMISEDAGKAMELVVDFTGYLRQGMESLMQKKLVPFDRELEHLKTYLKIEKITLKDRLEVVYDLEVTDFLLPVLTVLPLVENALHHGISEKEQRLMIQIATRSTAQGIRITVTDNGVGFDISKQTQMGGVLMGIANVRHRLREWCQGELILESTIGEGTQGTVIIPYKKEKPEADNSESGKKRALWG